MVINIRIVTDENAAFNDNINNAIAYVLVDLSNQIRGTGSVVPGWVKLLYDSDDEQCGFMTVGR